MIMAPSISRRIRLRSAVLIPSLFMHRTLYSSFDRSTFAQVRKRVVAETHVRDISETLPRPLLLLVLLSLVTDVTIRDGITAISVAIVSNEW